MFEAFLLLFICYLFGSISGAVVLSKLFRLPNPYSYGSGNPGASNVARGNGYKYGVMVLIFDLLKALIPLKICASIGVTGVLLGYAGLAAVMGHMYPIFHKFRGGKGVATSLGVMLALSWPIALCALGVFAIVVMMTRYSSLASMLGTLFALTLLVMFSGHYPMYKFYFYPVTLMSLLIIFRHWKNIERLIDGKENRVGKQY